MLKKIIELILKRLDIKLIRYHNSDESRLISIINNNNIDVVIDCGANNGLYSQSLRGLGYKGKIISFEPIKKVFEELQNRSKNDNNWFVNHYALGDKNEDSTINISNNLSSSSLLNIKEKHISSEPDSKVVRTEKIQVKTFSSVFNEFNLREKSIFFKIDVQGYEEKVLNGSEDVIDRIDVLQVELSLVNLYDQSLLLTDMIKKINNYGFELVGFIPVFWDKQSQHMLQVDGIFIRSNLL